jgi:hypothetical protein
MEMCNRTRTGSNKTALTRGSLVPAFQKLDILSNIMDTLVQYERRAEPSQGCRWPGVIFWNRSVVVGRTYSRDGGFRRSQSFAMTVPLKNVISVSVAAILCMMAGIAGALAAAQVVAPSAIPFAPRQVRLLSRPLQISRDAAARYPFIGDAANRKTAQCLWESVVRRHSYAEQPAPFEFTKGKDAIEVVLRKAADKCSGNLANMRIIKHLSLCSSSSS